MAKAKAKKDSVLDELQGKTEVEPIETQVVDHNAAVIGQRSISDEYGVGTIRRVSEYNDDGSPKNVVFAPDSRPNGPVSLGYEDLKAIH